MLVPKEITPATLIPKEPCFNNFKAKSCKSKLYHMLTNPTKLKKLYITPNGPDHKIQVPYEPIQNENTLTQFKERTAIPTDKSEKK